VEMKLGFWGSRRPRGFDPLKCVLGHQIQIKEDQRRTLSGPDSAQAGLLIPGLGPGCGLGVGMAARAGFGPWPGSKRAPLGQGAATPCWAGLLALKSRAASLGHNTRARPQAKFIEIGLNCHFFFQKH
jgi:hypothetical protein